MPVAQVRMENVEMRKDTYQVSDNITLVSYIVTVYVDDAAAAVAVTTRLTDTAGLKTAFIAAVLFPTPRPIVCVCVRARPSTLTPLPLSLHRVSTPPWWIKHFLRLQLKLSFLLPPPMARHCFRFYTAIAMGPCP